MTLLADTQDLAEPLRAEDTARSTVSGAPLSVEELNKLEAFWHACKCLALEMIYLQANPRLQESLKPEHIKSRLLGYWGSSPGLALIYIHLGRLIKKHDLEMIFLAGHLGPRIPRPTATHGWFTVSLTAAQITGTCTCAAYKEKGNINTPMELAINNQTDRFSLAIDAIDRVGNLQQIGAHAKEEFRDRQLACKRHAYEYGIDSPEISGWKWPYEKR